MPSTLLPSGSSRQSLLFLHSNSESASIRAPGNHHQRSANQNGSSASGHRILWDSPSLERRVCRSNGEPQPPRKIGIASEQPCIITSRAGHRSVRVQVRAAPDPCPAPKLGTQKPLAYLWSCTHAKESSLRASNGFASKSGNSADPASRSSLPEALKLCSMRRV